MILMNKSIFEIELNQSQFCWIVLASAGFHKIIRHDKIELRLRKFWIAVNEETKNVLRWVRVQYSFFIVITPLPIYCPVMHYRHRGSSKQRYCWFVATPFFDAPIDRPLLFPCHLSAHHDWCIWEERISLKLIHSRLCPLLVFGKSRDDVATISEYIECVYVSTCILLGSKMHKEK